jgi:hypothetical protein
MTLASSYASTSFQPGAGMSLPKGQRDDPLGARAASRISQRKATTCSRARLNGVTVLGYNGATMRRTRTPDGSEVLYGELPFGWRLSRDRSSVVEDRDEQRVIAIVRHLYVAQGTPMRQIAVRLAQMGIVNRRGKSFSLSRIWEMIQHDGGRPLEAERPTRKR